MKYTKADILKDLDSNGGKENPYKFFPMLTDPYVYISSCKIHLFADENRWAIVFEKNGYDGHNFYVKKEHNYFGNCLTNQDRAGLNGKFVCNSKYFTLCSDTELMTIENKDESTISKDAKSIKIHGKELVVEQNLNVYYDNKIPLENNKISTSALIRLLNKKYPETFNSSESELRTCLPSDLPKLMTIEEWYHTESYNPFPSGPNAYSDPSTNETFQLIADVLISKDKLKFKPTKNPNSHWSNWKSGQF